MDIYSTLWNMIKEILSAGSALAGIAAFILAVIVIERDVSIKNFNILLDLISKQNQEIIKQKHVERKANYNQFKQTFIQLRKLYLAIGGSSINNFSEVPIETRIKWVEANHKLMEHETQNHFLLEEDITSEKWMGVYYTGSVILETIDTRMISGKDGTRLMTAEEYDKHRISSLEIYRKEFNDFFDYFFNNVFNKSPN
jgi:hypothetical protein